MTLLEILLTLCLLVILASLTWPGLGRPMATQRLRESADQVRTEWVRARVDAMSTGRPYVFRYSPDNNTYSIEAQEAEDETSDTAPASPIGAADASLVAAREGLDEAASSQSQQRRLPDRVRFLPDQAAGQASEQPPASEVKSPATADSSLSQPVFFYPDGTCSDAHLRLGNEYGQTIDLSLRSLTGVVLVSEVRSAEATGP